MAAALSVALALAPPPPVSHAVTTEQLLFLEVRLLCFVNLAMSPRSSGPPNPAAVFPLGPYTVKDAKQAATRATLNQARCQILRGCYASWFWSAVKLPFCRPTVLNACSSACYILTGIECWRMGCSPLN